MPDLRIEDHGSVVLIRALSRVGQDWLAEEVHTEPWQIVGDAVAAEPRYVWAVVVGARADGLEVE